MTSIRGEGKAYTLRPADEADQTAIRRLVRSVGINPMGLSWPQFWVAVDADERIVGCAQIKEHREGARELASVAVRRPWRGNGIASALIRRLVAESEPPLWLTCRSSLIGFYRRFGFNEVADDQQMPRILRRVRRLVNGVFQLLPRGEYLAVMTWSGDRLPNGRRGSEPD